MKTIFLDFEQPLYEIEEKIEKLRKIHEHSTINITEEIEYLLKKSQQITKNLYKNLTPWQITQIARHSQRPYTLDYIKEIFNDFYELHGDRLFSDDLSIIGGLARINEYPCVIIGHQKGRNLKEKEYHNFGKLLPEGYRKTERLMRIAEKFNLPIFTFIDAPETYPNISAETRCKSEAIGRLLYSMINLKTQIIASIIGEGVSEGAIAIPSADYIIMLEFSIYSIISPESYSSIFWKNIDKSKNAAEELRLTSYHLKDLGLIDKIIIEPTGGAHRDPKGIALSLHKALIEILKKLKTINILDLHKKRFNKIMSYGKFKKIF